MQVVPSGGQICNQWKWHHLVAKFGTNPNGATWRPNLQLIQVASFVVRFGTNENGAIWWPNLEQMQMQVVAPGGQNWNQSLT